MSTQLKDKLVVRDHEGQFHVWTKAEYEAYVTDAIWMGATPSISIVTHFAGTEDLLKDVASHEASAPLPTELEEAAKEAAEHYIEDETLQFQTVCRQQGYSLDIIEEWAKVDYRKGFLAGSRYQSQQKIESSAIQELSLVVYRLSKCFDGKELSEKEKRRLTEADHVIKKYSNPLDALRTENESFVNQSQTSLPGDIIDKLRKANPYPEPCLEDEGYDIVCAKLRELISHHPATEQKQESADIKISAELPYHEEFEKWAKGIRKGKNTTMADLYYYWIENIHESKSLSAQASLKDHAVGFAEFIGLSGYEWTGNDWYDEKSISKDSAELYDLWPEREQSKQ